MTTMTTSISELRLQLFQDAPDFAEAFDLDDIRYSSIRENYFFYYYMVGKDTIDNVRVGTTILFEKFQEKKDNVNWEPYLKYYDEMNKIRPNNSDFRQVKDIIEQYRDQLYYPDTFVLY